MLKFKTSCAVLAYLPSNLLNEVGLFLFRYFEVGLRVCDVVVKKFTFATSSPDEFLLTQVWVKVLPTHFTVRRYASAVCAVVVCLSIRPSVCPSQAVTVPKQLNICHTEISDNDMKVS